jgi:hypothetical protein
MPMILRPCSLSSSSRSVSILTTIAVEDIASAPPSANAACQLMCRCGPAGEMRSASRTAWWRRWSAPPAPAQPEHDAAHRPQLGSENSRPIENIRNTTPNSASVWVVAVVGQAQRVRADQDADGQVAQHRRQVQHAESDHAQHGAAQQQEGQFKSECMSVSPCR